MSLHNRVKNRLSIVTGSQKRDTRGRIRELLWTDFVQSMPFWLPPTAMLVIFVYGSVLWNMIISLTDFQGISRPEYRVSNFDLDMYVQMLSDPSFHSAARNTVVFMIAFTAICLVIGLLLALLLDRQVKFGSVFRTIYLLPFSLSYVVTGVLWLWMFNFEVGVINTLLRIIGLGVFAQHWLSNPNLKLLSVILALVWQYSGYAMVIYLATLRTIPRAHYEAAKVDGASLYTMYRKVIIPQLSSAVVSISVVLMLFTLKAFSWLYVVFGRNPGPAADILGTMMYREAFAATNWAYGAAIGTVLFGITIIMLAPYLYWQYKRGEL